MTTGPIPRTNGKAECFIQTSLRMGLGMALQFGVGGRMVGRRCLDLNGGGSGADISNPACRRLSYPRPSETFGKSAIGLFAGVPAWMQCHPSGPTLV
jgi:hypothetical protein